MDEPGAALDSRVAELEAGLTTALQMLDIALAVVADLLGEAGNNYQPVIVYKLRSEALPLRALVQPKE